MIRLTVNSCSHDARVYAVNEDTGDAQIWFSRRIGPVYGYPFPLKNPSRVHTVESVTKQSTCLRNQSNPTLRYFCAVGIMGYTDGEWTRIHNLSKPDDGIVINRPGYGARWTASEDAECLRDLSSPTIVVRTGCCIECIDDGKLIDLSRTRGIRMRSTNNIHGTIANWKADEDAECLTEFRRQFASSLLAKCNVTRSYFETALWSSTYDEHDADGDVISESIPFDVNFDVENLSLETVIAGYLDCQRFMADNESDLNIADDDDGRNGHNFWLSRNGHGAGFFDRCDDVGERLQTATKAYGTVDLYVGDDGRVYSSDDADSLGATWGNTFIDLSLLTS